MTMNYISLFSGIEAASVAWEPLGLSPVVFSETAKFPCSLLQQRYPTVPNLGDITEVDWSDYAGGVDVIVGGSPCQTFSIQGDRSGLKGKSKLMLEYIRAVREVMPRFFVWENVPGALSCEGGAAFGQLLREMDDIGYGLAWRVLDAQFFRVPQRRRRVFLVGCLGSVECAARVLFEGEGFGWSYPTSREKRKELAANSNHCSSMSYSLRESEFAKFVAESDDGVIELVADRSDSGSLTAFLPYDTTQITHPANGSNPKWGDCCHTLSATGHIPMVVCASKRTGSPEISFKVRRITPLECERIQGFPDGYTDILVDGKCVGDMARFKAIGNSIAVPVMEYIGRRLLVA